MTDETQSIPLRAVPLEQVASYLGCDSARIATALRRLIKTPSAVELSPGVWVRVQLLPPPQAPTMSKIIEMPRRDLDEKIIQAIKNLGGAGSTEQIYMELVKMGCSL
jgi:hypothetical protein